LAGSVFFPSLVAAVLSTPMRARKAREAELAREEAERKAILGEMAEKGYDITKQSPEYFASMGAPWEESPDSSTTAGSLAAEALANDMQWYKNTKTLPGTEDATDYINSLNPAYNPVDYGKDVAETVAGILKADDTLKGVIFGPGGVTGNVIFGDGVGRIPGGDPAIYTGTYGGVNTGVTTGIPAVDAAIRRVLDQKVGGETTTSDGVVETAAQVLGIPIDEAIDILKDSGVLTSPGPTASTSTTPTSTTPTSTTPTSTTPAGTTPAQDSTGGPTVGVSNEPGLYDKILDWLGKNKDATDEEIRTVAENAKVTPEDIAKATGASVGDVQERWDNAGGNVLDTTTKPPVLDTTTKPPVLDTTTKPPVLDTTTKPPVLDTPPPPTPTPPPTPPPVITEERPNPEIVTPPPPTPTPTPKSKVTVDPLYGLDFRTVTTEPGDLALIKYLYDIGGESIFAPQMAEEDNPSLYSTYASGGKVAEFDIVEEALRLLRGD
jgi:hypothetical protein